MKLISYNIHKGIGGQDRLYRLERIMRVMEEQKPDILCLQEVTRHGPRSPRHDQPRLLAERFAATGHCYQMNVHYKVGGYGNLILSRWPLLCRHHISLQFNQKKVRGIQLAVIDTPEGPLHIGNWHLGLAEKERNWQVDHLLRHHLFREGQDLPTLIVGDSNDWRNTLGRGVFARHDFNEVTAPPSRFRSFPAFMAVMSLDKAFFRGDLHFRSVHIVHNLLSRQASDHLPLLVDFHLRPVHGSNGTPAR
jgi:endonuclease/exonuclease/phosphatase family metal-dependent hydrolase